MEKRAKVRFFMEKGNATRATIYYYMRARANIFILYKGINARKKGIIKRKTRIYA